MGGSRIWSDSTMPIVRTDETLERALLGGVLLWPTSRHAARVALPDDGISNPSLAALWRRLIASWDAGTAPDSLTLAEALSVDCRGSGWSPLAAIEIESLSAYAPSSEAAVEGVAKRLGEIALARRVETAGRRIVASATDPKITGEQLAQLAQSEVLKATSESKSSGPIEAARLVDEYWADLEARLARGQVAGLSTGLRDLDAIARLEPGRLWVAASRPGMGKSSYAGHLALSVARQGRTVLVFSLEMPRGEWIQRLACSIAGIDSQAISDCKVTSDQMVRLSVAMQTIAQLPILIDDTGRLSLWQLRSRAIATKSQHQDLGLVVVDYLQLVRADQDSRDGKREEEVSEISGTGKELAKSLDCCFLYLAQLNRACEQRADKRPLQSDLRESGAIEQDADVITFLYRDEVYNRQSQDAGIAEVLVAKNRSGPQGVARVGFDSKLTRFHDHDEAAAPPKRYNRVTPQSNRQEPDDEELRQW